MCSAQNGPAYGIVTKTINKILPELVGVKRIWGGSRGVMKVKGWGNVGVIEGLEMVVVRSVGLLWVVKVQRYGWWVTTSAIFRF